MDASSVYSAPALPRTAITLETRAQGQAQGQGQGQGPGGPRGAPRAPQGPPRASQGQGRGQGQGPGFFIAPVTTPILYFSLAYLPMQSKLRWDLEGQMACPGQGHWGALRNHLDTSGYNCLIPWGCGHWVGPL